MHKHRHTQTHSHTHTHAHKQKHKQSLDTNHTHTTHLLTCQKENGTPLSLAHSQRTQALHNSSMQHTQLQTRAHSARARTHPLEHSPSFGAATDLQQLPIFYTDTQTRSSDWWRWRQLALPVLSSVSVVSISCVVFSFCRCRCRQMPQGWTL